MSPSSPWPRSPTPRSSPSEVASALGLHTAGQQSPDEVVRAALRARRMLLVLDNLEHLPEAALWVADLLAALPEDVTVLATSRAPLRLQDEREVVVAPLALPDPPRLRLRPRSRTCRPSGSSSSGPRRPRLP